jgi:hypothetical protein
MRIAMDTNGGLGYVGDFNYIKISAASSVDLLPGTYLNGPIVSDCPNPVTRYTLLRMMQKDGLKIYDLSGTPVETKHIQKNSIYLIKAEGPAVRKIMVVE